MSNGKTLLAGVVGAAALFAIVLGAFTATNKAEPAEAICSDISCLMEFLSPPDCEEPEGPTGPTGPVGTTFFGSLCCETQISNEAGAAFFDPCNPPCLEPSCIIGFFESANPTFCEITDGEYFDSLCCETAIEVGVDAAIIDLCCEQQSVGDASAAFLDLGCECPDEVSTQSFDVLSQLFARTLRDLLGIEEPTCSAPPPPP